jgi:F-type H+-transporting ATPase subunit b
MDFSKILTNPFVLEFPAGISTTQWLIVRGIGLLLVIWVVVKFILPTQITPHLVGRREEIVIADKQVEDTMRETRQMRDDYRQRLEGIEGETAARMEEAVREAGDLREHIIAEAKLTAESIVRRGEEEVSRERAKATVGLRKQFVEDVIGAAEHAAERLDGAHQSRLVDLFVKNVGAEA